MSPHFFYILFCLSLFPHFNYAQDSLFIYFEHDQYQIHDSTKPDIQDMAELLLNSSHKVLYIHGYTDHLGSTAYNQWLSQKRALAVKQQLIDYEVPVNLIESVLGQGEKMNKTGRKGKIPEHRFVLLVCAHRPLKQRLQDLDADEIEVGQEIVLENLNFQAGRHYLLEESIPELKELLQILKNHPSLKIELQGHVCCAPNDQDGMDIDTKTQNLSVNRAKNIYEYLVRNNIDSTRLTYKGYGRTRPLYPREKTEFQMMKNRRVEIKILEW